MWQLTGERAGSHRGRRTDFRTRDGARFSDNHYRYVFAYDALNRITAADYSYATLDLGGGALAIASDSTFSSDST